MVQESHLVAGSSVAVWHFSDRLFDGIFRFHPIGGVAPPEPEDPSRRRHERFDTHLRQRADDLYEGHGIQSRVDGGNGTAGSGTPLCL